MGLKRLFRKKKGIYNTPKSSDGSRAEADHEKVNTNWIKSNYKATKSDSKNKGIPPADRKGAKKDLGRMHNRRIV